MKITIAGAGAMGSRFGLMLHNAGARSSTSRWLERSCRSHSKRRIKGKLQW